MVVVVVDVYQWGSIQIRGPMDNCVPYAKIVSFLLLASLPNINPAPHAQPLTKTGPCPALTRVPTPMPFGFQNNTMQIPLTPAQSVNCIETPPGFQAQLWASEEDAGNIIASLIIERQEQKIKTREQFSQRDNGFDEEEKW